jgi:hypothetical protein
MKRLLSLTLFGAVALAVPAANAQMRGGGMMGGRGPVMSHGPVSAGPAFGHGPAFARGPVVARGPAFAPRGPVGVARVSPGVVAGRPAGTRIVTPSGHVFFSSNPFVFNGFHHHHHFFVSSCFGFPCFNNGFFFGSNFGFGGFGSPFWSYPYYPYYGSYPYSDYTSAAPQQAVSSDTSGQVELAREVQQLSDQIEELRYEEGRRAERQTTPPPSSSGTSLSARTPAIATTFVLRDGSHVVAENYALTGQTLWIFDEHKARKIPMSDIDREATEKFNADNGIVIRLP